MENKEGLSGVEGEPKEIDWSANELVLPSDLAMLSQLKIEVERRLLELRWQDSDIRRVFLAADEALTNAIVHGNFELAGRDENKEDYYDNIKQAMASDIGKRKVYVNFTADEGKVIIKIRDEGRGIPTTNIPDPTADENLLKKSGRGLLLINISADKVEINGSEIIMYFDNKLKKDG